MDWSCCAYTASLVQISEVKLFQHCCHCWNLLVLKKKPSLIPFKNDAEGKLFCVWKMETSLKLKGNLDGEFFKPLPSFLLKTSTVYIFLSMQWMCYEGFWSKETTFFSPLAAAIIGAVYSWLHMFICALQREVTSKHSAFTDIELHRISTSTYIYCIQLHRHSTYSFHWISASIVNFHWQSTSPGSQHPQTFSVHILSTDTKAAHSTSAVSFHRHSVSTFGPQTLKLHSQHPQTVSTVSFHKYLNATEFQHSQI